MSTDLAHDDHGDHLVALPRGTMLSEYRIESVLGQGGFGITYLAHDTLLNEQVAVKEFFPNDTAVRTADFSARAKSSRDREAFDDGLQAFLTEARIIARFRHPNIMQVRRFFEAHGTGYIVLNFVQGQSLEDLMALAPLPEPVILSIAAGILDGLSTVHERAILHRDLKPRNVIMQADGVPILIDFGAARDFGARNSLTVTKIASPGYSSPEQYGVGSQQGPWSDFYSLGAMLYRAVTGRAPPDALKRLRDDPVVPASKVAAGRYSPALLRLIDRLIQIDETKRPASTAEIRKALPALDTAKPVPLGAMPKVAPEQPHDWSAARSVRQTSPPVAGARSRAGLWIGLLLAVFAAGGGATFWALRGPGRETVLPYLQARLGGEAPPPAPAAPPAAPSAASATPAAAPPEPAPTAAPVAALVPAPVPAPPAVAERPSRPAALVPGVSFQDCPTCPTMTVVPAGSFTMGAADGMPAEKPVHKVTIASPFAIGQKEVTFTQWEACVAAGGCSYRPGDRGWGRGDHPVIDLSWSDAQTYVAWLSKTTGEHYRLPSEAEWEYADRAGTASPFWWGDAVGLGHANCIVCEAQPLRTTTPVGSYAPNAFGLYDTAGNVAEWVEDCWTANYDGAPTDGSAVGGSLCEQRVLRGGSAMNEARYLRSASRFRYDATVRYYTNGMRVARDIRQP